MKTRFFKRMTAFIIASLIAFGVITVLPKECLPQIVIRAAAEESYLNIKNIEQINPDTSITINWVYFEENSSIGKMNIDVHHSENFIWNGDEELYIYIYGIITGSNTYKKIGTVGASGFSSSTIGFMVDGPTNVSPTITYSDIYFDLGYKYSGNNGEKSFVSCTKVYTSTKQIDEDNDIIDYDNYTIHIYTPEELIVISEKNLSHNGYLGITISIENDINMNGINWIPIGTEEVPFKGNIEGNGHTISNINISEQQYGGLVGYAEINNTVTMRNLNLINYMYNATMEKDLINAVLIGNVKVNKGGTLNIDNINTNGKSNVHAKPFKYSYCGGIIGKVTASANSYININNVKTNNFHDYYTYSLDYTNEGGLIGQYVGTDSSSILNINKSVSNSDICSYSSYGYCSASAGGLIGSVEKGNVILEQCCVNGKVRGKSYYIYTGGIIGSINSANVTINNCLVQPNIIQSQCTNGDAALGGFVGHTNNSFLEINNSFFSSETSGNVKAGFVAWYSPSAIINNCYFDIDTTGIPKNKCVVECGFFTSNWITDVLNNSYGITTTQINNEATYNNWDFDNIWVINDNGMPALRWMTDVSTSNGYIKLNPLNDDGISIGYDESILAYVYDNNNNRLSNVNLIWTSSNENVVTITAANNLGATIKGASVGTATITCIDTISGFEGVIDVVVTKRYIEYRGMKTTQNKKLYFDYSDDYFTQSATVFNQKLAQASLALELSSWTSYGTDNWTKNGNFKRDENLVKCFDVLNFDMNTYESQKYDIALSNSDDSVAFGVASKEITNADGSKSNLVAVAIRGGGYGAEWASNFNVGNNGKYAEGFYNASTGVYNYVKDYINRYNLGSDTKIWIVGFSRAAATANLTAARLNNDYDNSNIYCYTFATPQGYVFKNSYSTDPVDYKFDNIHNIINPADLVPTVALNGWDFGRFGKSHIINYTDNSNMKEIYRQQMSGKQYDYNKLYPSEVIEIDDLALMLAPSTKEYVKKNIQYYAWNAMASLYSNGDLTEVSENKINVLTTIINVIFSSDLKEDYDIEYEANDNELLSLIIHFTLASGKYNEIVIPTDILKIADQHYPEAYIAWVFSSDEDDIYSECAYKTAVIDCPVDVYVYDSNSILVASIINNKIVKEDVNCAVFGDQKRVYLCDDTYSIKLVGNDSGTMDYSIEEHDGDGQMTRRVSYYDLPLENGTTYTGIINDTINTPINSYDLTSDYGVYNADFDSNNSTSETYSITVNGGLSSKPFAYPGEQVTITALASNDTSVFSKWTTFSQIIFDDVRMPVATFIMPNEDIEITALTSQIVDDSGDGDDDNNNNQNIPSTPPIDNSNHGNPENQFSSNNSPTSTTFNVKIENKITGETNNAKATQTGENVTVDVGKENNGYYANIYTTDGNLLNSVKIESGKVKFKIQPDIDFYIIIDKDSHIVYEDVSSGAGIYELFEDKKEPFYIFVVIIAVLGFSSIIITKRFSKNKH